MAPTLAYPLRLQRIYEDRLWDGQRLAKVLNTPLPGEEPIGQVWAVSAYDAPGGPRQ